jgi:hypothetical protein
MLPALLASLPWILQKAALLASQIAHVEVQGQAAFWRLPRKKWKVVEGARKKILKRTYHSGATVPLQIRTWLIRLQRLQTPVWQMPPS